MSADGPSQGSIRFRVGLGENEDGQTLGFAWFESDGPVTITPQLFEVESRPDANVSVRRYGLRVEVMTPEAGGRNLVISALTNGVVITVGRVAPRPPEMDEASSSGGQGLTALPLQSWEITNVSNLNSVVRLVRRGADGATREDWTYACRAGREEGTGNREDWVWNVTNNMDAQQPPRGESVEFINGTNFVFGSDGKVQRLTVGTNGEEVVVRTISYDDDGRIVRVDDGTNGFLTVSYDDTGAVTIVFVSVENDGGCAPGPLMAPRPRLLGAGGGVSVIDAIWHYLNGNGSPITLPFSTVDTSSATPIKFDCVRSFVSSCHEPGDYHIVGTNYFPATGRPRLIVGDVPVGLDGTITYTGHCNWTFSGTMTGADDPYDFNAANRGIVGETLTAIGRLFLEGRGTPYTIQFAGSEPLTGSGHCGDK